MSVWLDTEAAEHARDLFTDMRMGYVVCVEVTQADGALLPTPSRNQPAHCTFWCEHGNDLSPKAVIVLEPRLEDDDVDA